VTLGDYALKFAAGVSEFFGGTFGTRYRQQQARARNVQRVMSTHGGRLLNFPSSRDYANHICVPHVADSAKHGANGLSEMPAKIRAKGWAS